MEVLQAEVREEARAECQLAEWELSRHRLPASSPQELVLAREELAPLQELARPIRAVRVDPHQWVMADLTKAGLQDLRSGKLELVDRHTATATDHRPLGLAGSVVHPAVLVDLQAEEAQCGRRILISISLRRTSISHLYRRCRHRLTEQWPMNLRPPLRLRHDHDSNSRGPLLAVHMHLMGTHQSPGHGPTVATQALRHKSRPHGTSLAVPDLPVMALLRLICHSFPEARKWRQAATRQFRADLETPRALPQELPQELLR